MEKESKKNLSIPNEQQVNTKTHSKPDSILNKKPLENQIKKEKHNSAKETNIKFSHPIKHFSGLQDIISRKDFSNSNLKSPFKVNNENMFGYRILFEAFYENLDKQKNSALDVNQNEGLFLGKFKNKSFLFFNFFFFLFIMNK